MDEAIIKHLWRQTPGAVTNDEPTADPMTW